MATADISPLPPRAAFRVPVLSWAIDLVNAFFEWFGELGIFAQESISRMHGIARAFARDAQDVRGVEIRGDAASAERCRLARAVRMQRCGVVFGIDGDGRDAEVGGGTCDADCDLSAIGDEQALERHRSAFGGRVAVLPRRIDSFNARRYAPACARAERRRRAGRV